MSDLNHFNVHEHGQETGMNQGHCQGSLEYVGLAQAASAVIVVRFSPGSQLSNLTKKGLA